MPDFIGKEKVKGGTLEYGATDPITGKRDELFTPDTKQDSTTAAPPPGGTTSMFESNPDIVDGSDGIRENMASVRTDAKNALSELDKLQATAATDLTAKFSDLTKLLESTKILTDSDLAEINQAGIDAGREYDPLISDAIESKRQGMATSKVGAGEKGGFENTQYAGQAAITRTEGGDFVGAGGKLSQIKGQLDQNIQRLETAKLQAISSAKAAHRKALLTGKKEDAAIAADLFKMTKDLYDSQEAAITKRIEVVSKLEEQARSRIEFGQQQEDRTIEGILGSLDLTGDDKADTEVILQEAKKAGIDPARLATAVDAFKAEQQQKALTLTQQKMNIAKQIPKGTTYIDPDTKLTIIGNEDPETMDIVQTIGGNEFQVRYDLTDPKNPRELFKIPLGPRWKGGGGGDPGANTDTTLDQALIETAKYLDEMKKTGDFNDLNYEAAVQAIYNEYNQVPEALPDGTLGTDLIRSTLNQKLEALEGGTTSSGGTSQSNFNTAPTSASTVKAPNIISRLSVRAGLQDPGAVRFGQLDRTFRQGGALTPDEMKEYQSLLAARKR